MKSSENLFLFNLKFLTKVETQLSLAEPILPFPKWVFNLPQSDIQTARAPKSEPVNPQSKGHLFNQSVRINQNHSKPYRKRAQSNCNKILIY